MSNRPEDAAEIERRVSDGSGLLAFGGSSVTNLLSGDAARSILTNSTLRGRQGVRSRDFFGFLADPSTVFRLFALGLVELVRELNQARAQRLREIEPRIDRGWPFPALRVAACVLLRDLSVGLVLEDMYRGVPVVYVDLVGYDEIAHHAGPERPEALDAIAEVDHQIGILERAAASSPRPYRIVVLSDHGQSQGATFRQRFGTSLEDLVRDLMAGEPALLAATSDAESWGYLDTVMTEIASGEGRGARLARRRLRSTGQEGGDDTAAGRTGPSTPLEVAAGDVVVAASGNLANVYFPALEGRATWEAIDRAHPGLVTALASQPGIGLVLVRSEGSGAVVLGRHGRRDLDDGRVQGEDPLAPFGAIAEAAIRRLDGIANVGDLAVISMLDPETQEVAAFEELVGSHGGLGGAQTEAFVVYPATFAGPAAPLVGAPAVHDLLVGWLAGLGLREARAAGPAPTDDSP